MAIDTPIEVTEAVQPLRLAILPVDVRLLEHIFEMPRGVQIVSVSYDDVTRRLKVLLTGDDLPEVQEGRPLPEATLLYTVETHPDAPIGFRRITAEVKVYP